MKIVFKGQYQENNLQPEISMTPRSGLFLDYARMWGEGLNPKKELKKRNMFSGKLVLSQVNIKTRRGRPR